MEGAGREGRKEEGVIRERRGRRREEGGRSDEGGVIREE